MITLEDIERLKSYFLSKLGGVLNGGVKPDITDTHDLGESSKRWNIIYAKEVIADNLTGEVGEVTNADTVDGFHAYAAGSAAPSALVALDALGVFPTGVYNEALLKDGTRALEGNLDVVSGATIDGIDVGLHDHTGEVGGAQLTHGNLLGMDADDHPQYTQRGQDEIITGDWMFTHLSDRSAGWVFLPDDKIFKAVPYNLVLKANETEASIGIGTPSGGDFPIYLLDNTSETSVRIGLTTTAINLSGSDTTYRFWTGNSGGAAASFYIKADGSIKASSGLIGGWNLGASTIYSDTLVLTSGTYPKITGGASTYRSTTPGFFLGSNSGTYVFFVGDYDTQYIDWDGSGLTIKGTLQSPGFASGISGWKIDQAGNAEFNNVSVRGSIVATVFEKALISAHAGSLIVTKSASTLAADCVVPSSGTWSLTVKKQNGAAPFSSGDIIRIKDISGDTWMVVDTGAASGDNWIYTATYQSGTRPYTYKEGFAAIDYGVSGDGGVITTADLTNAPYISVFTHAGSPWSALTEKARLGNLSGITGASGFGLSSENCFLEGTLIAGKGSVVLDDEGLHITHADTAISMEDAGLRYSRIFNNISDLSTGPWEVVLETGKPTGNIVVNGGFETGSLSGWTAVSSSVSTAAKRTGSYGLNMSYLSPGSASVQSSSFAAVTAGEQYTFELFFRMEWGETVAPVIVATVMWYTSGDAYISSNSVGREVKLYQCAPGGGPHEWERLTGTFMAPPTAAKMKVKIELNFGSATAYVDDISLSALTYGTVFKVSSSSTSRGASIAGNFDILNFPSTSNQLRFLDNGNSIGYIKAQQVDAVIEGDITIQSGAVSASQASLELNAAGDSVVTTVLLQSSPQKVSIYGDLSVLIPGDTGDITATGHIKAGGGLYVGNSGGTAVTGTIIATGNLILGSTTAPSMSPGIRFNDVQIYRYDSTTLYTPNNLSAGGNLKNVGNMQCDGGLVVGSTSAPAYAGDVAITGGLCVGYGDWDSGAGTLTVRYSGRFGSCVVLGDHAQAPPASSVLAMLKEQDSQGTIPSGYGAMYAATPGFPMWKNDYGALVPMFVGRIPLDFYNGNLSTATKTTINTHPVLGMSADGLSISDIGYVPLPKGWLTAPTVKMNFWWAPTDTNTGNVVFSFALYRQQHGQVLGTSACATGSITTQAPGVANQVKKESVTLSAFSGLAEGDSLWIRFYRNGPSGSDTYTNAIGLLSAELSVID